MISYYFHQNSVSKLISLQDQAHGNLLDMTSILLLCQSCYEWNLVAYSPLFANQKTVTMTWEMQNLIYLPVQMFWLSIILHTDNSGGSVVKNPPTNPGDPGSILESGDPLEKEMATHSSIFTWEIPWTEDSGGLQSMGSQRVRCYLMTKQQQNFT